MIPNREEEDTFSTKNQDQQIQNPELALQINVEKQSYSQKDQILTLYFDLCQFDDQTIKQYIPENMSKIYQLSLKKNNLTKNFLKYALFNLNFLKLKYLQLGSNNIGNLGIKFLVKIQLPALEQLFLSKCNIGDQGLRHLAKGNWPHLKAMTIWKNHINLNSLQNLNEHSWKPLKSIKTSQSQIGNYNYFTISSSGFYFIRALGEGQFDIHFEYQISCVLSEQEDDVLIIIFCNQQRSDPN